MQGWGGEPPPKRGQDAPSHTKDQALSWGGASKQLAEGNMTASLLRFGMAAGHLGTGCAPTLAKAPYSPPLAPLCPPCPSAGGHCGRLGVALCPLPAAAAASSSMAGGREGGAASAGPENRSGASGSGAGSCPGTGGKAFCKAAVAPSETCHRPVRWGWGRRKWCWARVWGEFPTSPPWVHCDTSHCVSTHG